MTVQHPVAIQEGCGPSRALVYLLHVGDSKPSSRYPLGTFDAVREACGPEPMVVVRGDDGTAGDLPVADVARKVVRRDVADDFEVSRIVVGGWSAGVRGIRRFLDVLGKHEERAARGESTIEHVAWAVERLAGIVASDGLHAPFVFKKTYLGVPAPRERTDLGPSEVFRKYVDVARHGERCPTCRGEGRLRARQGAGPECFDTCNRCGGSGYPFAFVLTHCMQDYMEAPPAEPRYLSTHTVASELTGWDYSPAVGSVGFAEGVTAREEGRLRVLTFDGPRVDYDGHVRQLREALPLGLRTMRDWGLLASG